MLPHDLLPITRPLEETNLLNDTYFYENIIKQLIPDIIRIEANGIPINLNKVSKLEDTVNAVLEKVRVKLSNNELMLNFLKYESIKYKKNKSEELESKKKSVKEFIKPFDIRNKIHRTYVVNYYLICTALKPDMQLDEWNIKDLKILNQIISSNFIQNIIDKKIEPWMQEQIDVAMQQLANDKCEAYNKNKIDNKIDKLQETDLIRSFNPGSSLQKQNFFNFYNIESENQTKKGNEQWNRKELERLQRLINIMIDEKGDSHESE